MKISISLRSSLLALLLPCAALAQSNLLTNPSFETAATIDGVPTTFGTWGGDQSSVVAVENGITPVAGGRMLKFVHTSPSPLVEGTAGDVIQLVDLSGFASQIAAGTARFRLASKFNRIAGDAATDTRFELKVSAYSGLPSAFSDTLTPLATATTFVITDSDPSTWQDLSADLLMPAGTTYAAVWVSAMENVTQDPFTGVEFAGHYADGVTFGLIAPPTIAGQPAATVVPAGGVLSLQVQVSGTAPFTYQWRKDTSPISGATLAAYTKTGFAAGDAGSYDVIVTNAAGSATSSAAAVTLAPALGTLASDANFTRPDFKQDALAGRVTIDSQGRVYATWTNANVVSGVGNQLRGAVIRFNADGTVDNTFNIGPALVDAWPVVVQSDGKVLVGGTASHESSETGFALPRVFRFNADGTRDTTYASPHFAASPRFMTLQSDGRLLVVVSSNTSGNGGIPVMARLNADGSLDSTFTQPVLSSSGSIFLPPVVDAAGKIYVGGIFSTINSVSRPAVARLNADGTVDTTWVPSGFTLGTGSQIRGLALQTQGANAGKLLVAGGPTFVTTSSSVNRPVIRLTTTGAVDTTFTLVTQADAGMSPRPRLISLLPDDRFYVVGATVTRFLADGAVDTTYTKPTFSTEFFWMDTMADGRVVVPPELGSTINGTAAPALVRLTATGTVDSTFAPGIINREIYPSRFAALADSKLLTWGTFDRANGTARPGIARFNLNGSLDPAFNVTGITNLKYVAFAEVGSDGKILAGTRTGTNPTALTSGINRLNADGTVDTSFALDSQLSGRTEGLEFRLLPDNKVAVWSVSAQGVVSDNNVLGRLTSAGAVDTTFSATGFDPLGAVYRGTNGAITSITVGAARVLAHDSAGRLIARATVGSYPANATALSYTLVRINPDGSRDTTFTAPVVSWGTSTSFPTVTDAQTNGGAAGQVQASVVSGAPFAGVLPVADGKYLVYGSFTSLSGQSAPGIARLTSTGAVDTTFTVGSGAQLRFSNSRTAQIEGVSAAADGKLWITGAFDTFNGSAAPGIVRLNADGSVDTNFATDISFRPYLGGGLTQVAFAPNGTVYVSGTYTRAGDVFPSAFQALVNTGTPVIATQPVQTLAASVGGSATLSVVANGATPLAYQWRKDGVALTGATNATYAINPVSLANAGSYDVIISNTAGSVLSAPSVVSVSTTVAIVDQPFSHRVVAGDKTVFRVTASTTISGAGLTYQWKKNGSNLPGATNPVLVIPAVGANDTGTYTVVVSDGAGAATSSPADLTVLPADAVLWQSFTDNSIEQAPARTIHDGAGKVYVPWSVYDRNPDMVGGKWAGALVRLNESDGSIDSTFRLDARYRRAAHVALDTGGKVLVAVTAGDANTVIRVTSTGALDSTFNAPLFARGIRFITRQADGKVIVVAADNLDPNAPAAAIGADAPAVYRLNADGSLDSAFTRVVVTNGGIFGAPVVDSTGRIYLAGSFNQLNGVSKLGAARLTAAGALDATFPTGLPAGFNYLQIRGVALQSGDRPVFVGDFFATGIGSSSDRAMAFRFTSAGAYDTTFTPPLRSQLGINTAVGARLRYLTIDANDKIIAVSDRLVRLNADGTRDTTFVSRAFGKEAFWVSQGADGRFFVADQISVAGVGTTLQTWGNGIACFSASGVPDESFQTGGWGRFGIADMGVVLSDGRVWVGGTFNRFGGTYAPGLALFAADGTLGTAQVAATRSMTWGGVADAGSEKIFALSGTTGNSTETGAVSLVKLTNGAVADPTFNPVLPSGYSLGSASLASGGGKLLLAQESILPQDAISGTVGDSLIRLNNDGTRDTGFNAPLSSFASVTRGTGNAITLIKTGGIGIGQVLADGRVLAGTVALDGTFSLVRLLNTGALDATFTAPAFGTVAASNSFTSPLFDPVTNTTNQYNLTSYSPTDLVRAAHQTAAGAVYVGGRFALPGSPRGLVRLTTTGALDVAFAGTGIATSRTDGGPYVTSITSDSLGRVYVAGRFDSFNGIAVPAGIFRLKADGTFDNTWGSPLNVVDLGRVSVRLVAVGAKLYAFGTVALSGDILPAPYRVADIPPPPSITTAPVAATTTGGSSATFSVVAGGTGPFSYQWLKAGAPIPGATTASYTIANATPLDAVNYSVAITGPGGTTVSTAVGLTVNPPLVATTVIATKVAIVNVAASAFTPVTVTGGTAPFTYAVAPALPAGVTIASASGAISGTPTVTAPDTVHTITVTDAAGATSTATFTLGVDRAPTITAQPANQTVLAGQTATFTVAGAGIPTPTYQWMRNGLNISGATDATFTFNNVPFNAGGSYSVAISNRSGSSVSNAATLTVNPVAPNITSPTSALAVVGRAFLFQIVANTNQAVYSVATGALPAGLTLNTDTGVISGIPTTAGIASLTLTASNPTASDTKPLAITVNSPPPVITVAVAPAGQVGAAYPAFTVTATNNPTVMSATGLPPGLTMSNTGVITGTPTQAGTFSASVTATNATGSNTSPVVITINLPPNLPAFTGSTNVAGVQGATFSFAPAFANGPFTNFSATGLPAGLAINAITGAITGTPSVTGTFTVNVTATNAGGSTTVAFNLTINPPATAPVVNSAPTASGTVGSNFTYTITASGTPAATSFAATGLPLSLTLNPTSGVITGVPTAPATVTVQLSATNSVGTGPTRALVITIVPAANAPVISSGAVIAGRVGDALAGVAITATNAPTGFVVTNGTLPAGLALNPTTGAITGTPTAVGQTRATIAATNATGQGYGVEILFSISPALTMPVITSNGSAAGQVGQPFQYVITATNTPTSFGATSLPSWLTLDAATGVLSGIPSEATTTALNIPLTATNASGTSAPKLLALTIVPPPATPLITSPLTANGQQGSPFTYQITASESPTSYVALNLPAGLSVITAGTNAGQISGTPTVAGSFTVTLRAANAAGPGVASNLTIAISPALQAPFISSAPSASGKVGTNFTYTAAASYLAGQTASPITAFNLTGTLPVGLAFNTSTGVLSGQPAESGLFTVNLTATSAGGTSLPQALSINIAPPDSVPVITSPTSAIATVGASFSYQITAVIMPGSTAFPAAPFPATHALDAVNLPEGLAVNPSTGLIQGQPTTSGVFEATLYGTSPAGRGAYRSLTITVQPAATAPVITSASSAAARVGTPFSYAITASNNPTAYEAIGGPAWMSVNSQNGAISGTPTVPGLQIISVRASNSAGSSAPAQLVIDVAPAANTPVIISSRTASGTVSSTFNYQAAAAVPTGAPPVSSYLVTGLPPGLSFNSASGAISGTPTSSGTFNVVLSATNSNGQGAPVTLVITISASLQFVVPGS